MNIQLSGAEEWIDQQMTSVLGQVLIRYCLFYHMSLERAFLLSSVGIGSSKTWLGLFADIWGLDATTSYGSKARIKTTGMEIPRWMDERTREMTRNGFMRDSVFAIWGR